MTLPAPKPLIAVTMGDPAGVGPELCLRLLEWARADSHLAAVPVVFGDASVLQRVAACSGLPYRSPVVAAADWAIVSAAVTEPTIIDCAAIAGESVVPGRVDRRCGDAAFRYVTAGIAAALARQVVAVCTAPINKEALYAAGHRFPGHTEIFADRLHAVRSCMMQVSDEVTCSFVTTHVGYAQVPRLLTVPRILEVIELTVDAIRVIRSRAPRLVVCGLNPHAGEHGLFGDGEEERIIVPAIDAARAHGVQIEGPLPPDTAFLPARRAATDAFVCMYHDQGHIPLKALAFDTAVNTTLGLPVVRTSVDHGTAFDIAWQGRANPSSLFHAFRLAARLAPTASPATPHRPKS